MLPHGGRWPSRAGSPLDDTGPDTGTLSGGHDHTRLGSEGERIAVYIGDYGLRQMVYEVIVSFLGSLLLGRRPQSKPVTPSVQFTITYRSRDSSQVTTPDALPLLYLRQRYSRVDRTARPEHVTPGSNWA